MTLLEHLEQRGEKRGEKRGKKLGEKRGKELGKKIGQVESLLLTLPLVFPEFQDAEADLLRDLSDAALDRINAALAHRRPWKNIRKLLRES